MVTVNNVKIESTEKNRSAGYSLLELMVATTVIAILSTMAVVYSRTTDRRARVNRQAEQLVFDIRRAQTRSLGTGIRPGQTAPCGYGVYFTDTGPNRTQYILYEERTLAAGRCPAGIPSPRPTRNLGQSDVDIETIRLPTGLEIDIPGAPTTAHVTFLSPEPRTTIAPGMPTERTIRVRLQSNTGIFRDVRVTTAGLIEVIP